MNIGVHLSHARADATTRLTGSSLKRALTTTGEAWITGAASGARLQKGGHLRMSQRRIAYFASACAAIALSAADGPVGAEDFDVENFHPVSPGDGELIAVQSTR